MALSFMLCGIMEKENTFNLTLRYYNVVIQPAKFHQPSKYIDLFKKVFSHGKAIVTGTDKITKMRSLNVSDDLLIGQLINASTLSTKNWYNLQDDKVVEHASDPNLYPNAREWEFYFMPSCHKMAVVVKRGIAWGQFEKYFDKAFEGACTVLGYDMVCMNRCTDSQGLEEIFALDSISSIEIEVSYSNNDNNDAFTKAIDDEFKESNVSLIKTKAIGTSNNPIKLKKEGKSYLSSLVNLSKNNGYTKAKGKVGRKVKSVNTRDFPKVDILKKLSFNNMVSSIKNAIESLKDD